MLFLAFLFEGPSKRDKSWAARNTKMTAPVRELGVRNAWTCATCQKLPLANHPRKRCNSVARTFRKGVVSHKCCFLACFGVHLKSGLPYTNRCHPFWLKRLLSRGHQYHFFFQGLKSTTLPGGTSCAYRPYGTQSPAANMLPKKQLNRPV